MIASYLMIRELSIHAGIVSLSCDITDTVPIKILRDNGASQSLLLADA